MFRLAADISKVVWTADEEKAIQEGLKELKTSDLQVRFFEYVKKWKLAPWTYAQLKSNDLLQYIDAERAALLKAEYDTFYQQNTKRNETAVEFLKAFKNAGIECVVLKGNYLAHSIYKEVGYKRMNDFDILIHREDWDKIQEIYLSLGYIPLGFGWSGEKEKPAKFSHVGMAFISADYSCIIGSQWGLKSPTTRYKFNIQDAWDSAVPFNFNGVDVKALSTEFNLLHLILHMGIYKCGIRDCMDVYNLLLTNDFDEKKLIEIIDNANANDKALFTLSLSNLCAEAFPESVLKKIKTSNGGYMISRIKKRLKTAEETGDYQQSYNDYFQDIEKDVIYFNLFPQFHRKAYFYGKIIGKIYFAKTSVVLKLNDKEQRPTALNKLISRLKAPYMIFSLIRQEIGWKFSLLIFLKLFIDLIVSLKNYIVKKESYFDYLKSRNIDAKDIAKAVKNIQ